MPYCTTCFTIDDQISSSSKDSGYERSAYLASCVDTRVIGDKYSLIGATHMNVHLIQNDPSYCSIECARA